MEDYIDSKRLEITCGEAPYLVSRYDASTGEMIDIHKRIGILERKLRVVNENANDETEWMKWAIRAFQGVYGYEYQGDNSYIREVVFDVQKNGKKINRGCAKLDFEKNHTAK